MGCASSIESSTLDLESPTSIDSERFTGAFVVVCGKPLKIDRDIRATLKLRANMVTLNYKKEILDEFQHILWDVGGVLKKRGEVLEAGENRLEFDYDLEGKLKKVEDYIKPEELLKKFGSCTHIKFDYILRAGSLQVKEMVQYPELFPPGEDGFRGQGQRIVSKDILLSAAKGSISVASLITSIVTSL